MHDEIIKLEASGTDHPTDVGAPERPGCVRAREADFACSDNSSKRFVPSRRRGRE